MRLFRWLASVVSRAIADDRKSTAMFEERIGTTAVPVAAGVWYSLMDGEEQNRLFPDTYLIPSRDAREYLRPGQIVKLPFAIFADGNQVVERMWVIVVGREGANYVGTLDNQATSTDTIGRGMSVRFEPRHVIDIQRNADEGP